MTDPVKPPVTGPQEQTALSHERTGLSHERTGLSHERTGLSHERTDLSHERTDLSKHRTDLSEDRTKLSIVRTLVALDRTLMAWVRTATSLISFGFTIYKFFEEVQQQRPEQVQRLIGPRGLALVLIGLGVGGLTMALLQYRREVAALHQEYASYGPFRHSVTAGLAAAISGLGLMGFVLVVLRQ